MKPCFPFGFIFGVVDIEFCQGRVCSAITSAELRGIAELKGEFSVMSVRGDVFRTREQLKCSIPSAGLVVTSEFRGS